MNMRTRPCYSFKLFVLILCHLHCLTWIGKCLELHVFCAILNWTQNLIIALLPSNSHLHLLFDLNEMTLACEDA